MILRTLTIAIAVTALACSSPLPGDEPGAAGDDDPAAGVDLTWPVRRFSREGPGEKIGSISLTDPSGGTPHPAAVGRHGLRIVLEGEGEEPLVGATVRVVYSRGGAADTRSFTAVESPREPGVYLGTVDLVAAGEWRFRIRVVDGGGGAVSLVVP